MRLAHAGAQNGTLIAAFQLGNAAEVYRSTDDGRTFRKLAQIDTSPLLTDPGHGGMCCIGLFELSRPVGAEPAGTLLWAGTVVAHDIPAPRHNVLAIWASHDQGATWARHGQCAEGTDLWEPNFHIANDGTLVCVYSDGTDAAHHSQKLTEAFSTDGGTTFGPPRPVVVDPLPGGRPGMATVAQLPDHSWVMTYEECGLLPPCQVHFRRSADGLAWGNPGDRGAVIATATGSTFWHTPVITWSPFGGPNGTLLVTGQIFNKASGFAEPGNGATILANTTRGDGAWTPIPAPVAIPNPFDHYCPNYSSPVAALDGARIVELATEWTGTDCLVRFATGTIPNLAPLVATTSTTTVTTVTTVTTPARQQPPTTPTAVPVAAAVAYTG